MLVKRKRKNIKSCNPTNEEIDLAINLFIAEGGKIKHIESKERTYDQILNSIEVNDVDDFLMGR